MSAAGAAGALREIAQDARAQSASATAAPAQTAASAQDADANPAAVEPFAANVRAAAAAPPLQLRIDRLVIDGLALPAGGERALRAALLQELQQLLQEQPPALTRGGAVARLPALDLALPAGGDATAVGRALAQALHRSLST